MNLNKDNLTELDFAENVLRDINERIEHCGTDKKCRDDVGKLCDNYWSNKNKRLKGLANARTTL